MRLDAWAIPGILVAGILGVGGLMMAHGASAPPEATPLRYDRYWVESVVSGNSTVEHEPAWGGAIASFERVGSGMEGVEAVRPAEITAETSAFVLPLQGWSSITDRFGVPRGEGRVHGGIDLGLWGHERSPVYAACTGTVIVAEYSSTYGYYAVVDCGGGWTTLSAHFSELRVSAGQPVSGGQTVLGISGSTGYSTGEHLHFEVRWQGIPVNPEEVLDFGG